MLGNLLVGVALAFVVMAAAVFGVGQLAYAEITVTDDFDRVVTLSAPAERILSLAPHITENLFSAGAGGKVVGVVEHSDYPAAVAGLPSVGSYAQVNLEAVLALAPDLVVAWRTARNKEVLEKIGQLGVAVYYSEPRGFEDIIENIEELGLLAGVGKRLDPSPARLREELVELRAQYAGKAVQSVFYQVWREPLMTLNGEHLISRALELCGARNVFAGLPIIAPRISVESVIDANPDIIITGGGGEHAPDVSMWRKWRSVNAVRNDGFVFVDSDVMHRQTARMILGIRGLCEEIDLVRVRGGGN